MIYLISDPHGKSRTGIEKYLEVCTESDLLIILGDLGLNFQDNEENRDFTKWFLSLDKPIALVEGNHENHAFINSFPDDEWCGGKVHRLSENIVHLKRGNIYSIDGKTFFVMGGCKSSAKWKEMGLWYEGEEPTEAELSLAYDNLRKCNNAVNYVLTHKYNDYKKKDGTDYPPLTHEGLTMYIDANVTFKHWYSGHWHRNKSIDELHTVVYDEPLVIPE